MPKLWWWDGGLNKNTGPWVSRRRKRPWSDPDQGQEEDDPRQSRRGKSHGKVMSRPNRGEAERGGDSGRVQ